MPAKPTDPEEIERVVASYQGGELHDGDVPIGVQCVPEANRSVLVEHFASKGFALAVEDHKTEKVLAVLRLCRLPPLEPPAQPAPEKHTAARPEPARKLPKEG